MQNRRSCCNRRLRTVSLLLGTFFVAGSLFARTPATFTGAGFDSDYTIPVEVESVSESPASITFRFWRPSTYTIFRKAPASTNWGSVLRYDAGQLDHMD